MGMQAACDSIMDATLMTMTILAGAFVGADRIGQGDIDLLRDDLAQVKGDLVS